MSGENTQPTGAQTPADESNKDDYLEGATFDDGTEENTPPTDEDSTPPTEGDKEVKPPEEGEEIEIGPDGKPKDQHAVNKKINKLTFEKHEALREKEAAEKRAEEAEQKLAEATRANAEVVIPPIPDTFDPEFEKKMKARDEAIAKKAQAEADKASAEIEKANAASAAQEAINQETQANVQKMHESAKANGIKSEDLTKAENTVADFLPPGPDMARFLLQQENADLIIMHLSGSAEELVKISKMSPLTAAAYITNTVAPEAMKLKPTPSDTPPPLDIPGGRGGGESENPYLEGGTFE